VPERLGTFHHHEQPQHPPANFISNFCIIYQSPGAQLFHEHLPPNQTVPEPRFQAQIRRGPNPRFKFNMSGIWPVNAYPQTHPYPNFYLPLQLINPATDFPGLMYSSSRPLQIKNSPFFEP
jgi:hypothetical protein